MDIGYLKRTTRLATARILAHPSYRRIIKMETHVLIPPEFMLKVRPSSQSPAVAKLLEQQVSVISCVPLAKGVQIHPLQGTVRCGKLDIYSTLAENDVSCFDFNTNAAIVEHCGYY